MNDPIFHLWILWIFGKTAESLSMVECPQYSQMDNLQYQDYDSSMDCTLIMSCKDQFDFYGDNSESCPEVKQIREDDFLYDCFTETSHTCSMRLKVTMMRNLEMESTLENSCSDIEDSSRSRLFPFPGNCSMFYKCNWGKAILFECPTELHFNADLQVCDWPWQARCDFTWIDCPRPYPRCPTNYPKPLYMPHPRLCDKFYQCDWGTSHLQTCPTGLHFNPELKICDWPYKANCQVC